MSEECLPWDVKILKLSLGGESDEYGFITFEVFDDNNFSIREGDGDGDTEWFYEEINIEAARRLRDFLNYAVPK
jgi:hypothetical protein